MEKKFLRNGFCTILVLLLSACASVPAHNPADPYESFNRKIYAFNDTLDRVLTKPIAKGYNYILPNPVKKGVGNFFRNIENVPTTINDLLQGHVFKATEATFRLVINSTVGIGGLIDVAEYIGFKHHRTDLGMTFARWGDTHSPYLVIPFIGPSTIRDTFAMIFDEGLTPLLYINDAKTRDTLYAFRFIDKRYQLLDADRVMEEAIDPYAMQRDAYLQYRKHKIHGEEVGEVDTYIE